VIQALGAGAATDLGVSLVPPAGPDAALRPAGAVGHDGFAYLLVQLGTRAARLFAEGLAPLGLEPRHAGMLLRLAANEGKSQQAIGELIELNPTRMVFLVDELEQRGLVQRRRNAADRRSYALYLTERGHDALRQVAAAAAGHSESFGAALTQAERDQLTALLRKLAAEQGIAEQGLPR
jgi:DNA-binding MarR family transcriptional regulator